MNSKSLITLFKHSHKKTNSPVTRAVFNTFARYVENTRVANCKVHQTFFAIAAKGDEFLSGENMEKILDLIDEDCFLVTMV